MSDRVKHKSRFLDREASGHRNKKSHRHRSPAYDERIVITSPRDACRDDRRQREETGKHREVSSRSRGSERYSDNRSKPEDRCESFSEERQRFFRNGAERYGNVTTKNYSSGNVESSRPERKDSGKYGEVRSSHRRARSKDSSRTPERRVLITPAVDERPSRKKHVDNEIAPKRSKKSHKRKRSPSSSSSSGSSSSSRSSSSSSGSSDTSSSSDSSDSSSYEKRKKRRKRKKLAAKKLRREEKKRKRDKKKMKKSKNKPKEAVEIGKHSLSKAEHDRLLNDINVELADRAKAMAPMTREQWEKKQSVVRRVYDEETGRQRLIKGDGEVLEEIVSRDRHMGINKKATQGDGEYFQSRIRHKK